MGFRDKLQGAFGDVFDELGGVKSVPDVDRRGLEEIEAEKQRRALEETAPIAQPSDNFESLDIPEPDAFDGYEPEEPTTQGQDDEHEADDGSAIEAEYEVLGGYEGGYDDDDDDDDDDIIVVNPASATPAVSEEPEPAPEPVPEPKPEPESAPMPEPNPAPSSAAWVAGMARSIQLEEFGAKPAPKPKEPKAPKPASEPQKAPESIKAPEPQKAPEPVEAPEEEPTKASEPQKAPEPTKAPEPAPGTPEPKAPEPVMAPEKEPEPSAPTTRIARIEGLADGKSVASPELGITGLDRCEKARLVEDYAAFADTHVVRDGLMYVLTGALWAMEDEPEQLDGFKRYIDAVKRSRLKICYRDALHVRDNKSQSTQEPAETLYATEALAMAAVTQGFSEAQHRYLKQALKNGSIKKDELVSKAYLAIGEDGSPTEISEEEYREKVASLPGSPNEPFEVEVPPLLEPDEVYHFVQSVENVDQERGVDDLVLCVMKQLIYYDAEARQLAEDTLTDIYELAAPIMKTVYKANGQEFDSYAAALAALRAAGDLAFNELMGEDALARSITRIEYAYSQTDGTREFVGSGPVSMRDRKGA